MLRIKNVSALEKVLPAMDNNAPEFNEYSCLLGERFSYQVAFMGDSDWYVTERVNITVLSDIKEYVKIYEAGCVPVITTAYPTVYDNGYISRQSSVIPDVLTPSDGTTTISTLCYKAIWITVDVPKDAVCGEHTITVKFDSPVGISAESTFRLNVIGAVLPKQTMPFTQWFHADCISSYYGVKPLSEEHWLYIEKFIKIAAENGINMLLTPVFTLPLDTKVGAERPTVQLADVEFRNGEYTFGFEKLGRWLEICRRNGIEYIEIAHLFTQWGAEHAPKIVIKENGEYIKKFGWHTDSLSDEYMDFLAQLLPRLTEFLKDNWRSDKVYFHISDEPSVKHVERYGKIFDFLKPYLSDFNMMDAVSHYEIYEKGYIETPVCTIRTIDEFIEHKTENLWGYYCCMEGGGNLSNRFTAMPSYRNRIIAEQLYKYNIKGFLHWGYNFYFSQFSTKLINPYITNDADGGFPAGDSFSVYPGTNGPLPSLRMFVFYDALQDMRAFRLAESLAGRKAVLEIIERRGEITFKKYPCGADYILNVRKEINSLIKENINNDM